MEKNIMAAQSEKYPASLDIDYVAKHDRMTALFRIVLSLPILLILTLLPSTSSSFMNDKSNSISATGGVITLGLTLATALMILVRQSYPKWWYDFALELNRFSTRVGAYMFLLTDRYPSTVDAQDIHLNIDYPDVKKDLNRYMPLVKWLLAIPHYIVLGFLVFVALIVTVIAWFSILLTGKYPKDIFDFVVGVGRYGVRLTAYAFLLTTDIYPPFSLK